MRNLILTIEHDQDAENPIDGGEWTLVSFNRRHEAFQSPDNFFPLNVGNRRKLKCGTLFLLGYYEHGLGQWALSGEQNQCQWDSSNFAGLLYYTGNTKDLCAGFKAREESARIILVEYTDWCNGQNYWFSLETEDGEIIDSCGGLIGYDSLMSMIKATLRPDDVVTEVKGEYAQRLDLYNLGLADVTSA